MLNLTGLPALDLAIGLAFIFFLLSTLAAVVHELIAAALGLRARTLEQGLRSMLEDPERGWKDVDDFYDHPLIRTLYRGPAPEAVKRAASGLPPEAGQPKEPAAGARTGAASTERADARPRDPSDVGRNARTQKPGLGGAITRGLRFFKRTEGPSYISPRAFALVLLDNFAPREGHGPAFDDAAKIANALPAGIRDRLSPVIVGAQDDVDKLRTGIEAWYDDTMARVSGWYKRKTQVILLVIGIAVVLALNANAITMGQRMWKDDIVRSAVVAQAQGNASHTTGSLGKAANDVDRVAKVGIPMGWRGAAVPRSAGQVGIAIGGWLLTILAISLGAPFWFDALSRLSRLRSSGKPETPLPASGSGKPNERILTPPQVPSVVVHEHVGASRGAGQA